MSLMFFKDNNHQVGEHRSISIARIRPATSEEWDFIWRECDYSTYFHSREWAEIWKVYTEGRMRPDPKLVLFSDGKKALLPFSSEYGYKGLVKNYISSPPGAFGGWLSTDEMGVAHAVLLAEYLTKKIGNLFWQLNPYDELAFKVEVCISKNLETHALNLTGGFDTIFKIWSKGNGSTARKAKKAFKSGVWVRPAATLKDWQGYFDVYEKSLRRWGNGASSVYRWTLFDELFQRNSSHTRLWIAIYQDEIVAGALCFYAKKNVVYWHGSGLEKYFSLRPVNLLMCEIIKDACEHGYTWFDFGCSGGHDGVEAFKKSFGPEVLACPVVSVETKWTRTVRNIVGKII